MASAINKDIMLVVSLVLSVVSLVLLFGVTWYCQTLQQQAEHDRELLFKLQKQMNVSAIIRSTYVYVTRYDLRTHKI